MQENPARVLANKVRSFAKIRFETLIKTEVKTGFKHIKHIKAVIYLYNCMLYLFLLSYFIYKIIFNEFQSSNFN